MDTKKSRRVMLVLAIFLLGAIIIFSTMWLWNASRSTADAAVYDISRLYLDELTMQKARQFNDTMDSCIQQLWVTVRFLGTADIAEGKALQKFIREMKEINEFDFFALADNKGMVYTEDATFPGISKFDFLSSSFGEPVISFDQSMGNHNMVLIAVPVSKETSGDSQFIAAMAGMNVENVAARLALSNDVGESFSNIIMANGSYVVRTPHEHLGENANIFSALEKSASFVNGTSLGQWREDLAKGRAGMAAYELGGVLHYTYYIPIEKSGWFIMTTLHYDFISGSVEMIRTTLNRNSMFQMMLIVLVLAVLAAVYGLMNRKNDRLWMEKIQAEEGSKAKSAFLSNMSHDIRTPMNAIIGFTNLAIKNVEDIGRTREYLAKILASSNHLLALINDVLEMSRIESGKIQLDENECSLPEILHDLNTIILGQVQSKQQELIMDALDVVNENVYCDRLRMNQVLLNLLSNAVKYTPAGGKISVRIEQLGGAPEGYGSYVIRVKDNGIGMQPEFAEKIFNPFERERTSTVSGIQGTGLGMSITKNIVELMGGTIALETEAGKGSEFIVKVNLRLQEKQNGHVHHIAHLEGIKALVVDDDFDTCDATTRMLMQLGIQAEWTMSGREAVLRAKHAMGMKEAFGIYILDWQLPDLGGVEVARQIRSLVGEDVPILVITAYDWTTIAKDAKAVGVNAFCNKPVFMSELQAALFRATGQQAVITEEGEEAEEVKFEGKRILLVEDNEINREIAMEILTDAGFGVEEAEDGQIAVEKVRNSAHGYYDVVLMDVQMPVMNGYEATREIRALADEALAGIPIIAMTANAFEEDKQAALDAGMNGHLAKPIDTEKLFRVLAENIWAGRLGE